MNNDDSENKITLQTSKDINGIELLSQLKPTKEKIRKTCSYFFKGKYEGNDVPFRGFILLGPPGTGKTEVIRQVAKEIDKNLQVHNIITYFALVDGANIAAPKWGDAEKNLKDVFQKINYLNQGEGNSNKIILLFDDIESLVLKRGADLAKEWHYSINSILFHELDKINPSNVIMCATSNKPELVDDAILTRLYPIDVPSLPIDQLIVKVENILNNSGVTGDDFELVKSNIQKRLETLENPTIRDAQHFTIVECIENEVWK
ncbi:AAA ATPase central domain protein [Methanohalobium evestigatum Z-7303]|uniref:AAA ATPase central domain protein n=1 Tax=Methanohalobium evestigatum (strain ATCC BAA-1072 / DSM 3721 / NBRC 107634 / OCM 161 / Z-7303) TaxID=644295 RepID=D7E656_METEZ|nr:ATP-binding protein [Methanohalobium evestigatum]ADI73078.1 AAA ATPase central domain protein [Methanohalobium evestigatum Z-7303]